MNFSLSITPGSMESIQAAIQAKLEGARKPVQAAMASAVFGVVSANFGSVGFDRPRDWQPLSEAYAKKVGRTFATLYVTGALKATLQMDTANDNGAWVTMGNTNGVPYALAHHNGRPGNFGWTQPGSGELPARRVFPMDMANDEVMPKTVDIVNQAAMAAATAFFQ